MAGQEHFQKVAYIGLNNPDGSMLLNVPLYIKVTELSKSGVTQSQEQLIHRISEIMIRQYEKQISAYFQKLKKEQRKNESDTVSG